MTLWEFYNMNLQELGQSIKVKYPQYQNVDDVELANKIIAKYPVYKNQITEETENKGGFLKGVGDVIVGAGKGLLNTVSNASKLGQTAMNKLYGAEDIQETITDPQSKKLQEVSTPTNTAQKAGFIGEQIAEFFIPGGASAKAGKAAEMAVKGGKIFKNVAKLGAASATEAALAGGQTALQKGGFDKEAKTASIIAAVTPTAVKAGGKILKGVSKLGSEALGKATGTSGDTILEAFKNPNVAKYAREAGKDLEGFQNEVLSETKKGLSSIAERRAKTYQSQLEKIKLNPTELDSITSEVRDRAVSLMDNHDISIIPQEYGAKKLNVLDFSNSTLIEGSNVVEKALNDVMGWTENTASGLDKLKRRLSTYVDQLSSRDKRQAQSFVLDLKNSVDDGLKKNVKGYEEMTQGYRQASGLIDDINKTFSLGNNKMKETALKKIMGSLKDNNESRKELLQVLGGEDLVGKVAGAQLSKAMPRGIAGALGTGAGLTLSFLNPANIPAILTMAAMTSPRVVAETANVLGRVNNQMIKLNKFSPEIERTLRELFVKSNSD